MVRHRFIEYDHDETFDEEIANADENQIQQLLATGKIKCAYATKKIVSGSQVEIEIYPEFTRKQMKKDKTIKKKQSDAQKKINSRNAEKKVTRLINANFTDGDIWATLNYDNANLPKSMKEAQKNMVNYIKRLKYQRKKLGINGEFKYLYITEWKEGKNGIRCHHHMICSGDMTMDLVESIWKGGRRNKTTRTSKDAAGLTGMAVYISKDPKGSKRWCASTNLKKPIIRKNHRDFSLRKIRQMIKNNNLIREFVEAKYQGMIYLSDEARFNEYNARTYFYIRLALPDT